MYLAADVQNGKVVPSVDPYVWKITTRQICCRCYYMFLSSPRLFRMYDSGSYFVSWLPGGYAYDDGDTQPSTIQVGYYTPWENCNFFDF